MKKIIAASIIVLSLAGCSAPNHEYVPPKISVSVPKQIGPNDTENEKVAEARQAEEVRVAEEKRKAEEARVAEEKRVAKEKAEAEAEQRRLAEEAEQKRIADLEAENQRKQKAAEEARQAELERQKQQAKAVPAPAPKQVPPPSAPTPAWITNLMQARNYYAPANTVFIMTSNMAPCPAGSAGCTTIYADGRIEVRLNSMHEFVLMHEIAHTNGILDECAADAKAREVTGQQLYVNCK